MYLDLKENVASLSKKPISSRAIDQPYRSGPHRPLRIVWTDGDLVEAPVPPVVQQIVAELPVDLSAEYSQPVGSVAAVVVCAPAERLPIRPHSPIAISQVLRCRKKAISPPLPNLHSPQLYGMLAAGVAHYRQAFHRIQSVHAH